MSEAPRYCIDTSSLVAAWVERYPPDVVPSFWPPFERSIARGLVIAPDEVREEIANPPELRAWAAQRSGMFRDLDAGLQQSVREVVAGLQQHARRNGYKLDPLSFRADPFVIALARLTGTTVVSEEGANPSDGGRPKIPNLCGWYGLRVVNLLTLMREQGFRI
jgi:Domain of unknown function (DUF4411)